LSFGTNLTHNLAESTLLSRKFCQKGRFIRYHRTYTDHID